MLLKTDSDFTTKNNVRFVVYYFKKAVINLHYGEMMCSRNSRLSGYNMVYAPGSYVHTCITDIYTKAHTSISTNDVSHTCVFVWLSVKVIVPPGTVFLHNRSRNKVKPPYYFN